jgi:hypothetical protein
MAILYQKTEMSKKVVQVFISFVIFSSLCLILTRILKHFPAICGVRVFLLSNTGDGSLKKNRSARNEYRFSHHTQ